LLLARWRARHDSVATWSRISAALDGRCRVSIATWRGEPVAGVIVLDGPNTHYTHGAMRKDEAGRCYANYALHWHEIRAAAQRGARHYHMGESGSSGSLARFKRQFGAQGYEYADYRDERLPFSRVDHVVRSTVKRMIRFREPAAADD
jgi:lipid II:glycine glycyltransferase (peptidoglycan interpeptide bridge formation enzyme)